MDEDGNDATLRRMLTRDRRVVVMLSASALLVIAPAATAQRCLNDEAALTSEVCVVDPANLGARGDSALSVAFDPPARRQPEDPLAAMRGQPLAVAGFEVDGAPPLAGPATDATFLDHAALWVVPNNQPEPGRFKAVERGCPGRNPNGAASHLLRRGEPSMHRDVAERHRGLPVARRFRWRWRQ